MPATATGRGAQVILTGQARRAARGSAGLSLVANETIKAQLELAGAIGDGTTPDGLTATGAAATDFAVIAPESELGASATGPYLPLTGGTAQDLIVNPGPLLVGTPTNAGGAMARIDVATPNGLGLVISNNPVYRDASATGGTLLHLQGPDSAGATRILVDVFNAATPAFTGRKAGGTSALPTGVLGANALAQFGGWSYDGSTYGNRAQMVFVTSQTHSVGANGTLIRFQMTKDATAALFTAMEIRGDGGTYVLGDLAVTGKAGFYGTAPVTKPTVSGAKGSNAALASLLTALVAVGIVADTTTA